MANSRGMWIRTDEVAWKSHVDRKNASCLAHGIRLSGRCPSRCYCMRLRVLGSRPPDMKNALLLILLPAQMP
jgi:hypothetical protein